MGAGRTDAGVHANQMFAHFDTNTILDSDKIVFPAEECDKNTTFLIESELILTIEKLHFAEN